MPLSHCLCAGMRGERASRIGAGKCGYHDKKKDYVAAGNTPNTRAAFCCLYNQILEAHAQADQHTATNSEGRQMYMGQVPYRAQSRIGHICLTLMLTKRCAMSYLCKTQTSTGSKLRSGMRKEELTGGNTPGRH